MLGLVGVVEVGAKWSRLGMLGPRWRRGTLAVEGGAGGRSAGDATRGRNLHQFLGLAERARTVWRWRERCRDVEGWRTVAALVGGGRKEDGCAEEV